ALFRQIALLAAGREGPGPAGRNHLLLKVVVAREALSHRRVGLAVRIDQSAVDRTAGDELLERLAGQCAGTPMTVVAGLAALRSIDAEQANRLRTKSHRVAVDHDEARLRYRRHHGVIV